MLSLSGFGIIFVRLMFCFLSVRICLVRQRLIVPEYGWAQALKSEADKLSEITRDLRMQSVREGCDLALSIWRYRSGVTWLEKRGIGLEHLPTTKRPSTLIPSHVCFLAIIIMALSWSAEEPLEVLHDLHTHSGLPDTGPRKQTCK